VYPTDFVGASESDQMDVDVVDPTLATLALNTFIDEFGTCCVHFSAQRYLVI
jgi:hypothetical protein